VKIASWNVNGLRGCIAKGFLDYLRESSPDIIAIQETKVSARVSDVELPGYTAEWAFAERPGYSGTLCLFRRKPLSIAHGLGNLELDQEGRLITLEYKDFYFVCVYVPNSQGGLSRWCFRLDWDTAFRDYLESLQIRKPVIVAGDFNVAHDFIDIYPENLRNNEKPYGFLTEERDGFNALLEIGLVDVFREIYPDTTGAYSWWSNRHNMREKDQGWRIDYFLASAQLLSKVKSCIIRSDVFGSDHAPIELLISL